MTREAMWQRLGEEDLDVLVIGGGINGAGIARDAALRGLKVGLVEARDLAYGTSSRSSKLVHGGLRYLEMLEFSLVFEAVSERRILMDIAPHLVHPLGFLFPVYRGSRRNLTVIKTGLWLYEGLSLFRSPQRHRRLRPRDVAEEEPALTTEGLKGAPLYYDCSTDDARLTLETALDAALEGATIATWAKAVSFLKEETTGRVEGAVVKCGLTGALKEVRATVVINATGPWTDRVRAMSREPAEPLLRPTKGIHIVVRREVLPVHNAVVCFHPADDRVLFAIPWGDHTYLGTTDTDYDGDPGQVYAEAEDVDYLISAANQYFPGHQLQAEDVICTWAGLRPLIAEGGDASESQVSREHQIIVSADGLITIAGGKLTTYRKMSAEVMDTAVKLLRLAEKLPKGLKDAHTDERPLPGAQNWPDEEGDETVVQILEKRVVELSQGHLDEDDATYLVYTYGVRATEIAERVAAQPELGEPIVEGYPELMVQVDWSVFEELAATVTDILVQRTQIYYRAHDQGLAAAEIVADRMAELLGWDDETRAGHVARYVHDVELSREWKKRYDEVTASS